MMELKEFSIDVRHFPDLERNLISLGMLDQNGYCYKGKNGGIKVLRGSLTVMKDVRENGLYILQGNKLLVLLV